MHIKSNHIISYLIYYYYKYKFISTIGIITIFVIIIIIIKRYDIISKIDTYYIAGNVDT